MHLFLFFILLFPIFTYSIYSECELHYGEIQEVVLFDKNGNREGNEDFIAGESPLTLIYNTEGETFYDLEGEFVLKVASINSFTESVLAKYNLSSLQGSFCSYVLPKKDESEDLQYISAFYEEIEKLWKPIGSYSVGQEITVLEKTPLFSIYRIYSFPKPSSKDDSIWQVPDKTLSLWVISKHYLFVFDLGANLPTDVQEELYNGFIDQFSILEEL